MADVDIRIVLEDRADEDADSRFEPASVVRGTARLQASDDIDCQRVLASLEWHTEGRGDRDAAIVDSVQLLQGPLRADTPISQSFSFTLPSEPWSYAGYYINIVWEITVTVDVPFAWDINRTKQIVVAPQNTGS